jgi:hypothetical protein
MLKLVDSYEWAGHDYEVWECEYDGWSTTIPAGADIACCPECETRDIEQEGEDDENR